MKTTKEGKGDFKEILCIIDSSLDYDIHLKKIWTEDCVK